MWRFAGNTATSNAIKPQAAGTIHRLNSSNTPSTTSAMPLR